MTSERTPEPITDFAQEHGITEKGVRAFIQTLRILRHLPDEERFEIVALVAKCQIERDLHRVAFKEERR